MRDTRGDKVLVHARHVQQAISLLLGCRSLLESHRQAARFLSAILFTTAVVYASWTWGPTGGAGSLVATCALLLGAVLAIFQGHRMSLRLETVEKKQFTLNFLLDALNQTPVPNVFVIEPSSDIASVDDWIQSWLRDVALKDGPGATTQERQLGWLRLASGAVGLAALVAAVALVGWPRQGLPTERTWNFEDEESDPKALGLQLSTKETGDWLLIDHDGATGNRALVNLPGDRTATAASAVVSDSITRDFTASTRCKAAPRRMSHACGLVFRYVNPSNHYVVGVDTARGLVILGIVLGGAERELRSVPVDISSTDWQELAIVAQADHLLVSINGREAMSVHDPTFAGAGRVGMWAPSDGEAYFDRLSFSSLPSTRVHPSDLLPLLLPHKT